MYDVLDLAMLFCHITNKQMDQLEKLAPDRKPIYLCLMQCINPFLVGRLELLTFAENSPPDQSAPREEWGER